MLLPRESGDRLVTPELYRYVHAQDWPQALKYDLSEADGFVWLLMYRDNFLGFDGVDLEQIANVTNRVFLKLRANGIPIFLKILDTKPTQVEND